MATDDFLNSQAMFCYLKGLKRSEFDTLMEMFKSRSSYSTTAETLASATASNAANQSPEHDTSRIRKLE